MLTQNGLRGRVASIDLWGSLVPLVNPSELSSMIEAASSRPFEEWQEQGYANRNR